MDLNKLFRENKQNIRNIIKLITKEENDDLEQEVYVKVLKNSDKYIEKGTFKTWVSTIAKNVSKDYLKSSAHKIQSNSTSDDLVMDSLQDNSSTPELKLVSSYRQKKITKAINDLKPKLKEVIILTEFEDLSYEDCAKKLRCPIGTIKSRIFTAKKELAESLGDLL